MNKAACFASKWAPQFFYIPIATMLMAFCAGCCSPGRSRVTSDIPPVDDATRATFGKVGLLMVDLGPRFSFSYPQTHSAVMSKVAGETYQHLDHDDDVESFLTSVAVSGIAGVVASAFAGVSDEEVEKAERAMRTALKDNPVANTLTNRIQVSLAELGLPPLSVVPSELAACLLELPFEQRDYSELACLGLDAVLEIHVESHRFSANEGFNRSINMEATVHVQVVRVADNSVLFAGPLHYHGHRHRYLCWASDNARRFRSDVRRVGNMLGRGLVAQVLEPADTSGRGSSPSDR